MGTALAHTLPIRDPGSSGDMLDNVRDQHSKAQCAYEGTSQTREVESLNRHTLHMIAVHRYGRSQLQLP